MRVTLLSAIALCSILFVTSCGSDNTPASQPDTQPDTQAAIPAELAGNARVVKVSKSNAARVSGLHTYEYDEYGRLIASELSSSGIVYGYWTSTYSEDNNLLTREYQFTNPNSRAYTISYVYEGNVNTGTFKSYVDEAPNTVREFLFQNDQKIGFEERTLDTQISEPLLSDGTTTLIGALYYNDSGQLINVDITRPNGDIESTIEFTNNTLGHRTANSTYDRNGWWTYSESYEYEDGPCFIKEWYCVLNP